MRPEADVQHVRARPVGRGQRGGDSTSSSLKHAVAPACLAPSPRAPARSAVGQSASARCSRGASTETVSGGSVDHRPQAANAARRHATVVLSYNHLGQIRAACCPIARYLVVKITKRVDLAPQRQLTTLATAEVSAARRSAARRRPAGGRQQPPTTITRTPHEHLDCVDLA